MQKPLNYEKYRDLENEFEPADLVAFIKSMGQKYKDEQQTQVRTP